MPAISASVRALFIDVAGSGAQGRCHGEKDGRTLQHRSRHWSDGRSVGPSHLTWMFTDNQTRGVVIRTRTFDERERLILVGSRKLEQRRTEVLPDCVWIVSAPTLGLLQRTITVSYSQRHRCGVVEVDLTHLRKFFLIVAKFSTNGLLDSAPVNACNS